MSDPIAVAREHFDSAQPRRERRTRTRRARRVNLPVWGFSLILVGAVIVGMHLGLAGIVILALVLA
jgi:hypothetical protein